MYPTAQFRQPGRGVREWHQVDRTRRTVSDFPGRYDFRVSFEAEAFEQGVSVLGRPGLSIAIF